MTALPTFVTEVNALQTDVNNKQTLAATSQSNAATSETNAAASASAAAASSNSTVWVSGTTYAVGDTRFSPINHQTFRRRTAGAGTTDPSLDGTNWAQISGSALVLLQTVTVSAGQSSVDIDSTFDSTYDAYEIVVSGLVFSTAAGMYARLKIGGSYLTTSTYQYATYNSSASGGAAFNNATSSSSGVVISQVNGSPVKVDANIKIHTPTSTSLKHSIYFTSSASDCVMGNGVVTNSTTGALTGVRIFPSTGTISAGVVRLYGLRNS